MPKLLLVSSGSSFELTLSELAKEKQVFFASKEDAEKPYAPRGILAYGIDASAKKYVPENLLKYIEAKKSELTVITKIEKWWYVEGKSFSEEVTLFILPKIEETIMSLRFERFPFPILDKATDEDSLVLRFGACNMFVKSPAGAPEEFKIRQIFEPGDQIEDTITRKILLAIDWLSE